MAVVAAAAATGISALFSVTLLRRWWDRGRTNQALLIWGVALAMFCVASAGLLSGVVGGWTSPEFRTFYLFGGVLNVSWLALGSIAVNARSVAVSRWTGAILVGVGIVVARQVTVAEEPALWLPSAVLAGAWGITLLVGHQRAVIALSTTVLAIYSIIATVLVVVADYVTPLPAGGLPEGAVLFEPMVRGFAVGGNSVGAVTVVVSALVSSAALVWRRPDRSADRMVLEDTRRGGYVNAIARWIFKGRTGQGEVVAHLVRGNLLIALGVAVAAAGGVLSFLGETVGHAISFTVGVAIMYAGFVRTTRPVQ
ncbi:MAG: hypothetical protein WD576_04515 [Nitriliruptoraceae bacterium]